MPSKNRIAEVDAYIAKSPEFARPILTKLRQLFHRAEPRIQETMKWGVPHFEYKGMVGSFAAFKQHVGFGFWKSKLLDDPAQLFGGRPRASMSVSKLTHVDQLPSDAILIRYIKQAVQLNEDNVKVPTKVRSRPKLTPPPYLIAALKKNKKAKTTFDGFSESNRRDYVEWLLDARQEVTRKKRLATTLDWLAQGKPRNWKYMKSKE